MTPDIKPFLREADRRRPDLRTTNTVKSCFELLQLTLALAGPEWFFVGKTLTHDGAMYRPTGFTPYDIDLRRPDGQTQRVRIEGLSQDAAWHLPSSRQMKVIVNSGANEPGPWEHGPASLDSYMIKPEDYRWHNPPVKQFGVVADPWTPGPVNPPPVNGNRPGREEMMHTGHALHEYYKSHEGLQRPEGLWKNGEPDWEGIGAWLFDVYYNARLNGMSPVDAYTHVIRQIRQQDEWKMKHPGETP